jgi:hypothetical protein
MRVIVGSRDTPLSLDIITAVVAEIVSLRADQAIGIRIDREHNQPASTIELLAETLAEQCGHRVIRFSPTKGGRSAIFFRDYDLVEEADGVLAFFAPEREMEGGTAHVVKAAVDRGVKVDAYGVQPDGQLWFIGSEQEQTFRAGRGSPPGLLLRLWQEGHPA